jgi:protein dithiol oxidoreductase (disulfide-forming)
MKFCGAAMLGVLALLLAPLSQAAQTWTEGTHYAVLSPIQPTAVAKGKVEVLEVFSYACPYCNRFQPLVAKLEKGLPPNAQMVFLPAAFSVAEDFPMFQRAYFTAQLLGVAARTHQAMFDAVWETGELATMDPSTQRMKNPLPSIEDAAKFYERVAGVKAATFLATAKSFAVDAKMRSADAQIVAMQIPGTPCLIVNGKYRVIMDNLGGDTDLINLVRYLVDKDSKP